MLLIGCTLKFKPFRRSFLLASLPPMGPMILLVLLASLFPHSLALVALPPTSRIKVMGAVYCDVCLSNSFTNHSYFLPGVDVQLQCRFKANSPGTAEQISFAVNRTTNKYGVYELEIPSVDGVDCIEGPPIESLCEASLIRSPSSACNVAGFKTTSYEITVKSKQANLCIYCFDALSYKPSEKDAKLCANYKQIMPRSFDSSKSFLPSFPPFNFTWPPLPQLPPLPTIPFPPLPPFPSFPFPPPSFTKPPPLPFPFPPVPPTLPMPAQPPPPPAFNLGDPGTWAPHLPTFAPPPPPAFNLGDPSTWIPNIPSSSPPPPSPAFNLGDPSAWIPNMPPSPPNSPPKQDP
ncbi:leucine-rich repeat extensin-like protein 3 [Malania oleifera]|uniref:leucine-rich repeat extensin-like protein 3 n=1 Tax=Malania oleifera TaxID=397392 RepID=UPI0025AE4BBE|nr:leucine-rich repeat extensin-like protein 3 [Malania oleifera]